VPELRERGGGLSIGLGRCGEGGRARRGDVVPRLSYASVEEAFLELAAASPVRSAAQSLGRRVTSTLEGLKARRCRAAHASGAAQRAACLPAAG